MRNETSRDVTCDCTYEAVEHEALIQVAHWSRLSDLDDA